MCDNEGESGACGWLRSSCEVSSWVMETKKARSTEGRRCWIEMARAGPDLVHWQGWLRVVKDELAPRRILARAGSKWQAAVRCWASLVALGQGVRSALRRQLRVFSRGGARSALAARSVAAQPSQRAALWRSRPNMAPAADWIAMPLRASRDGLVPAPLAAFYVLLRRISMEDALRARPFTLRCSPLISTQPSQRHRICSRQHQHHLSPSISFLRAHATVACDAGPPAASTHQATDVGGR
jgi:hypothetical protein